MLNVFEAHPDVILVGNSITEVDEAGVPIREVFVGEDQYFDARTEPDADRLCSVRCLMGTSRMAVRRTALAKILPFEKVVLFEADEFLFNLLPALGRVCILSHRLTDYRLHGENNYQSTQISAGEGQTLPAWCTRTFSPACRWSVTGCSSTGLM